MKPIPQSDGTSKWKVEDIPPESATQHLPEPAFAPAPAPGPELALPLYDEDDESDWDPIGDIYDSARVCCHIVLRLSSPCFLPSFFC